MTFIKKNLLFTLTFLLIATIPIAQQSVVDSTKNNMSFSGSVGLTNNGFSIVPTFSLNSPATITNLSWRKNKWSIDPDVRLVPDLSKGGILIWLRYHAIQKEKFSLRLGAHPAFSFIHRTVTNNGVDMRITEMLRFAAFEVVPNYRIKDNWSVGAVYLHGNGLQKHGPQQTDVLFLNTVISNIKLGGKMRFTFVPVYFHLFLDGFQGDYFTATGILSKQGLPFNIQGTINQTIKSNIPGNQNFQWNVMLAYMFGKNYKEIINRKM